MPYKNDDLNEMFQKAARDYPLKTDNSDWNNVAAKLERSARHKAAAKTKRLIYASIFLFLVFGSIVLSEVQFDEDTAISQRSKQQILKQDHKHGEGLSSDKTMPLAFIPISGSNNIASSMNRNAPIAKSGNFRSMSGNVDRIMPMVQPASTDIIATAKNSDFESTSHAGLNDMAMADNIQDKLMNKISGEKNSGPIKVHLRPHYKIYGFFYGGPEFSVVKFQRGSNAGFRLGVGLGYKINDRFSAEIRLQREHIHFYSDGKYIDTSLLRIKPDTEIKNANVSSKITSVPVIFRYNFPSGNYGNFSVAAGVNAVIITHSEQYQYEISKNGEERNLSRNYSSLKKPKYFSGVNASVAYERKLSDRWNVKMEPYYQAPVNNFGVGKLPVSNFGFDVGIIKSLR